MIASPIQWKSLRCHYKTYGCKPNYCLRAAHNGFVSTSIHRYITPHQIVSTSMTIMTNVSPTMNLCRHQWQSMTNDNMPTMMNSCRHRYAMYRHLNDNRSWKTSECLSRSMMRMEKWAARTGDTTHNNKRISFCTHNECVSTSIDDASMSIDWWQMNTIGNPQFVIQHCTVKGKEFFRQSAATKNLSPQGNPFSPWLAPTNFHKG